MSVHQTKDGRWYSKYWEDGKYNKKYFGRGKTAKTMAEDHDLKVKRIKKRKLKVGVVEPKFEPLYVDELARMYLNDKRNNGWREKSVYNFKAFMNAYVIPFLGEKRCTDVTMVDLLRLKDFIVKKSKRKPRINPHTVNRYICSTRTVFNWGVAHKLIPFNPWQDYKAPKERSPIPNLLTVEELLSVMAHAPEHCRWAIDVEYNTGCRPGETELLKLKFSDVHWKSNEITIRGTKTGERKVPLKEDFMERLREAYEKAESDYIITFKGKPVKRLQSSFETALKRAGIKKRVRLYDLRHMYGTLMAKNKADIFALQKLMGHSDIQTTQQYLHHADELKKDAVVNCLPELDLGQFPNLVPKISPQKQTASADAV